MKILLSPSKKQLINRTYIGNSKPFFISKSEELIWEMKSLGREGLKTLLNISDKLTDENWIRVKDWIDKDVQGSAAIYTYVGEVFNYLDPISFSKDDLTYSNEILRIFSGLYGILKPLDIIKPYRLDIKDPLKISDQSLYSFWKKDLTDYLKDEIIKENNKLIINLSSKEYSKSVDFKKIPATIITPDFKTEINGKLKTVPIWSKWMRGLLTREIILNRVESATELEKVKLPGYKLADINKGNYLYIKDKEIL